jgi:asparagine synthase (glutamine-hydrolysing)
MCGIVGVADKLGAREAISPAHREHALEALAHRGPDARGDYEHGTVWLGHTRLSILDLSTAGAQPMRSGGDRWVISYNGEVYNFRELASRHGLKDLRSATDTEVVLRLFASQGPDALAELNGIFAFAVYDARAQKLWLVRDRAGVKPLYFTLNAHRLIFASEIKAILALRSQAPECDVARLHEWLYFGNALGGGTLVRGIRQLPPAHYLELDLGSFAHAVHPHRRTAHQPSSGRPPSRDATVLETRCLLERAVQRQLVSDVPVGVFLSGGVDSSAIAAFAARAYPGRLATYTVGFDFGTSGAELRKARNMAALCGTLHHEVQISGASVPDLVEKLVRQHDSPFSDAANLPLYLMASRISSHTKVVLQGDGGDELFGGYQRYTTLAGYHALHPLARLARRLRPCMPDTRLSERVMRYASALAAEERAVGLALLLTPEDRDTAPTEIFAPALRRAVLKSDPFARHRECLTGFASPDMRDAMFELDMAITLPDLYLEKVDRATMAASLEVRVPFLDQELVEFVARLPAAQKVPWGRKKDLLKAALAGIVPDEILHGPKVGLEVPFGFWLRDALRPFFLDHLAKFARRFPEVLDVGLVSRLYAQTCAGRSGRVHLLWKVLNLMVWANGSGVSFADDTVN